MALPAGMSWRASKVWLIVLGVFLSGALSGAVAVKWYLTQNPNYSSSRRLSDYWKDGSKEMYLAKLKKQLDLTEDQTKQIETLLDDFVLYFQTLQAQMEEARALGKDQMLKILTEDQKKKFESILQNAKPEAQP